MPQAPAPGSVLETGDLFTVEGLNNGGENVNNTEEEDSIHRLAGAPFGHWLRRMRCDMLADTIYLANSLAKVTRAHRTQIREVSTGKSAIQSIVLGDEIMSAFAHHFPPPEDRNLFFQSFLLNVHPLLPICHPEILEQELSLYESTISPRTPAHHLVLVLAVLYVGAITSPTILYLEQAKSIYNLYYKVMESIEFPSRLDNIFSLQMLQGYLIMNTCRASQHDPLLEYDFLPRAIRMAQLLKLHIVENMGDPTITGIKRHIWWHLVFLDVESSIATGLPPLIHSEDHSTQMPSSIWNDHKTVDNPFSSVRTELQVPPMLLALYGRWQWAQKMQKWMRCTPSQDEFKEFSRSIESLLSLMPESSETEWPRLYLNLQVDRAFCVIGPNSQLTGRWKDTSCHSQLLR
jgi:hypothetical protein